VIRFFFRRLRKNERGAAMLEFAIVIPFLLLLLMGIVEFGWIFNGYITLTGSAREGARLAVVGAEESEIREAVRNHATAFTLQDADIVINPGVYQGDEAKVTVTGEIDLLIGLIPSMTLQAEATMRREMADED
jgi:Flp pilus assembly protein TadG